MKRALLDRLLAAREAKAPAALVTELASGRQALFSGNKLTGDLGLVEDQVATVQQAIAEDRSGPLSNDEGFFVQVFNPPLRMIVVGSGHIARALAPLAALAGYEVVLIDPRGAWATAEPIPNVTLTTDWPDQAFAKLGLGRRSAVVTLSHDPELEDPALAGALRSEAFYIGALGSERAHAKRLARLEQQGLTTAELERIHGPAGLSLGGRSPAEIAVSILAQVTQVLHGAVKSAG